MIANTKRSTARRPAQKTDAAQFMDTDGILRRRQVVIRNVSNSDWVAFQQEAKRRRQWLAVALEEAIGDWRKKKR